MAGTRSRSRRPGVNSPASSFPAELTPVSDSTGRYLVLLNKDAGNEGLREIANVAGLSVKCSSADFGTEGVSPLQVGYDENVALERLSIVVVTAQPQQYELLHAAAGKKAILAVEPEGKKYAISGVNPSVPVNDETLWYLHGYKDAVEQLHEALTKGILDKSLLEKRAAAIFTDDSFFTWGLEATGVRQSNASGQGVKIAILDTGIDQAHPDFINRSNTTKSFIDGESVQDEHVKGHGTHCTGIAVGPKTPAESTCRYGCAYGAELFAGKVLSNEGVGNDFDILAGIDWAITNGCRIISLSLADKFPNGSYSPIYEAAASTALKSKPGTLIVAAAGNHSNRPGNVALVAGPANCPSILAVGAIGPNLAVADFSNAGVDIVAPGLKIKSSVPARLNYYTDFSGTSMANPFVSGIAALWLQISGLTTSAEELRSIIIDKARFLPQPKADIGVGLVQAPC
jgi:subtilisin family serine protease